MLQTLRHLRTALATHGELPPALRPLARPLRYLWVLWRQLAHDRAFEQAGAMAYTTLVALVPLLLLIFAGLDAIGLLEQNRVAIQALVFDSFLGDIDEVRELLVPGLVAADFGTLGLIGIVGLGFVAWRLYVLVEHAYSGIFGVEVERTLQMRVLLFYVGITVVPVIFVVAFLYALRTLAEVGAGQRVVFALVEFLGLLGALRFFPNTRVHWGPALLGAGTSVVLLQLTHGAFRLYVQTFAGGDPVRIIYGSLAALPVFLLWLWLLWVVVLVGVEVAAVTQNYRSLFEAELEAGFEETWGRRGPGADAALHVAAVIAARFAADEGPAPEAWIVEQTGMTLKSVHPVLHALDLAGLVGHKGDRWFLLRPPEHVDLREITAAWREKALALHVDSPALQRIRGELDGGLQGSLADATARWCGDIVRSGT